MVGSQKPHRNCWESPQCQGDNHAGCPAYPGHGRGCWKVTGTHCAGGRFRMASLAEKILYCRNHCQFYRETFGHETFR